MSSPARAEEKRKPVQKAAGWLEEEMPGAKKIQELGTRGWHYGAYLDLGYSVDFNHPENGLWRSKSTTFRVDDPRVNMAMGYLRKDATLQSRWGIQFGLQTGVYTDGLVPVPPPAANEPISNADLYRHLVRANASYLFPLGDGFRLTGGLINSHIAYESYYAMQNPNYTRAYMTDNVPYFFFGAEGFSPSRTT